MMPASSPSSESLCINLMESRDVTVGFSLRPTLLTKAPGLPGAKCEVASLPDLFSANSTSGNQYCDHMKFGPAIKVFLYSYVEDKWIPVEDK